VGAIKFFRKCSLFASLRSDTTPLMLDSGDRAYIGSKVFELSCFIQEDFCEMVVK
jgi:hypothetical protein